MNRTYALAIIISLVILNISCLTFKSCENVRIEKTLEKTIDATLIPYQSFVFLTNEMISIKDECEEDDAICKPKKMMTHASGTFVYRSKKNEALGVVMTAAHFCDNVQGAKGTTRISTKFTARDWRGKQMAADFVSLSHTTDICFLIVYELDSLIVIPELSDRTPRIGERVFSPSAPGALNTGGMTLLFEGLYSGRMTTIGSGKIEAQSDVYTIPTAGGSSGAPIYNAGGFIVGMTKEIPMIKDAITGEMFSIVDSINYAVTLEDVRDAISSIITCDELIGLKAAVID